MSFFEHPDTLMQLQKLLTENNSGDDSSDSEADFTKSNNRSKFQTENNTFTAKQSDKKVEEKSKSEIRPETIDDILADLEHQNDLELDTRKSPDFNITYKQSVSPEDVFLQLSDKTTSSKSCEQMVIAIQLPEETVGVERMELSITEDQIDLSTPVYRLKMCLAHKVNPDKGVAKYDDKEKTLFVTLTLVPNNSIFDW